MNLTYLNCSFDDLLKMREYMKDLVNFYAQGERSVNHYFMSSYKNPISHEECMKQLELAREKMRLVDSEINARFNMERK